MGRSGLKGLRHIYMYPLETKIVWFQGRPDAQK